MNEKLDIKGKLFFFLIRFTKTFINFPKKYSFFTSLAKKTVKIMFHEGISKDNLNLKNSLAITFLYCTVG